jgi:DNA-directed RNA polymerase specialized sigma24 family protein
MNHNLKEKMLPAYYEYSQSDVAEKLFLAVDTVRAVERRAIEKFKKGLVERGIDIKDLL